MEKELLYLKQPPSWSRHYCPARGTVRDFVSARKQKITLSRGSSTRKLSRRTRRGDFRQLKLFHKPVYTGGIFTTTSNK